MKHIRPATILLAVLLAVAGIAVWDYVELRRLDAEFTAVRARGEPATFRDLERDSESTESEASRLYRAAAILAPSGEGPLGKLPLSHRYNEARASGDWPEDVRDELRRIVAANAEPLRLIDLAAGLAFEGFPSGTGYMRRSVDLSELFELAGQRTTLLALAGDGPGAVSSLYSELRLFRPMGNIPAMRYRHEVGRRAGLVEMIFIAGRLRLIFSNAHLAVADLDALQAAFAELDDDDLLRDEFLRLRAGLSIDVANPYWRVHGPSREVPPRLRFGESLMMSIERPLVRPFLLHGLNRSYREFGEMIEAAARPWLAKLDIVHAGGQRRRAVADRADWVARELALIRSARTVIAVEAYRRANADRVPGGWESLRTFLDPPLLDPYSGQPLKIAVRDDRYVVYSVGSNRRDDGGNVAVQVRSDGRRSEPPTDHGIAIRLSETPEHRSLITDHRRR